MTTFKALTLLPYLFLVLTPTLVNAQQQRCNSPAATLESETGEVVWKIGESEEWQAANVDQSFCYGDSIKVVSQRAALRLTNNTLVRLQEKTIIHLLPEQKSFWISLKQGAAHFLTRTPKQFTVKAPYLNAAVDGTEFVVTVNSDNNHVAVLEGQVSVDNKYGKVILSDGMQSTTLEARAPEAPTKIRLQDAAEWALYYPPLIVPVHTQPEIDALIRQEQYPQAIERLTQLNDAHSLTVRASLELVLGQNQQAKQSIAQALRIHAHMPEALALAALMDLTEGDAVEALIATEQLSIAHPNNTSVFMAYAYALQGHGEIDLALDAVKKANKLTPDNIDIQARLAELLLSNGEHAKAKKIIAKALKTHKNNSQLNTLAGFIELNHIASKTAEDYFKRAIASNNANSLSYLGYALALIQQGQLEQGRQQMELAVLLDPNSSLLRSYLGKTYFEGQHNDWSATQYQLAKTLDPNDPTPWFYEAHLKLEQNKLPEALRLMNTAIEKNDNRAVYRSRMLLDSDAAARSANQAAIYQQLGFEQLAIDTAAIAVTNNPTDFAAHQALTLAYSADPKAHRIRANEALLTKLYQPIGAKALSVGTGVIGLQTLPWFSPSEIGLNEYSSLFTQQGISGDINLFEGTQDSKGYEVQTQMIGGNTSIDLGQYKYQTDGFRNNNYLNEEISEIAGHYQALDNLKLFAQYTKREHSSGDLTHGIESEIFDDTLTNIKDIKTSEFGSHYEITKNHSVILHVAESESIEFQRSVSITPFGNFLVTTNTSNEDKQHELAYLYNGLLFNSQINYQVKQSDKMLKFEFGGFPLKDISSTYTQSKLSFNITSVEQYGIRTTVSGSYNKQKLSDNHLQESKQDKENEFNLGLLWHPYEPLTLLITRSKNISQQFNLFGEMRANNIFNSPIEQTTGYFSNNFSTSGSISWIRDSYSVILHSDQSNKQDYFADQEVLDISFAPYSSNTQRIDFNIHPGNQVSINSSIMSDRVEKAFSVNHSDASYLTKLELLHANINTSIYLNPYMTISTGLDYIEQTELYSDQTESSNSPILWNASLTIKLPNRMGKLKIIGQNLSDKPLSINQEQAQVDDDITNPVIPSFASERSIAAVLSLDL